MRFSDSITNIKGIGPKTAERYRNLGIFDLRNLLYHLPFRYIDLRKTTPLSKVPIGKIVAIKGRLSKPRISRARRRRMSIATAIVTNDSDRLAVTWFNQPYIAQSINQDDEYYLVGKVSVVAGTHTMQNPLLEKVSDNPVYVGKLIPVYPTTTKLHPAAIRKHIAYAMANTTIPDDLTDVFTDLEPLTKTLTRLHSPATNQDIQQGRQHIAKRELLYFQLSLLQRKDKRQKLPAITLPKRSYDDLKKLAAAFPFTFTADQKKALRKIIIATHQKYPMNCLLRGDVGSGKTAVAVAAMLHAVAAGYQAVMMAPTEVLALQHYQTLYQKYLFTDTPTALLTGTYAYLNGQPVTKQHVSVAIKRGHAQLVFGTHALLQKYVTFYNLALVVIDEQHRFGVRQRQSLLLPGRRTPHLLTMTATPIPRSLQLTIHGDVATVSIRQKPKGRQHIATRVVPKDKQELAYAFMRKHLDAGFQAFMVCPLIEEAPTASDTTTSIPHAAETIYKQLIAGPFKNYRVGLLHGKLTPAKKEHAMQAFTAGYTQLLVTTSVIEVGVDVPNATIMAVKGAECFGLAQLHQFRGRVGRGQQLSFCFLFSESTSQKARRRLRMLETTDDGFKLAAFDLRERGAGELFGTKQSGDNQLRFTEFYNLKLIKDTRRLAQKMLAQDPTLATFPNTKKEVNLLNFTTHTG